MEWTNSLDLTSCQWEAAVAEAHLSIRVRSGLDVSSSVVPPTVLQTFMLVFLHSNDTLGRSCGLLQ